MCPPLEPHWTAYVQAIGTPFVALVAGGIASLIAYRQWQTAKEKVVLDLFKQRLEVYDLVNSATMEIIQRGTGGADSTVLSRLAQGSLKSKFLFGPEVIIAIERAWRAANRLSSNGRRQALLGFDLATQELLDDEDKFTLEIVKFNDVFDELVAPYMRMDAKLPRLKFTLKWKVLRQKFNWVGDWLVAVLIKQNR
ncbi:hypothetical protein [Methylobacterium sp. Leaf456]|uniref:hypothetical protein n=1 Tax=Methylobacterium sp. Leaf456 TaxID=1736382 RepID=UPI0012E34710|nr:hypothetical protein [Methylobacterium sp. Leaf456]